MSEGFTLIQAGIFTLVKEGVILLVFFRVILEISRVVDYNQNKKERTCMSAKIKRKSTDLRSLATLIDASVKGFPFSCLHISRAEGKSQPGQRLS